MHKFATSFRYLPGKIQNFSARIIQSEPMFKDASFHFAREHGGPITREFLDEIPHIYKNKGVFNSFVHQLEKNWYPCAPGYCQDYNSPKDTRRVHVMNSINDKEENICPIEFGMGECVLPEHFEVIYNKYWYNELKKLIDNNDLYHHKIKNNYFVLFDDFSLHHVMPASSSGSRWTGRLTIDDEHVTFLNEFRKQSQICIIEKIF